MPLAAVVGKRKGPVYTTTVQLNALCIETNCRYNKYRFKIGILKSSYTTKHLTKVNSLKQSSKKAPNHYIYTLFNNKFITRDEGHYLFGILIICEFFVTVVVTVF